MEPSWPLLICVLLLYNRMQVELSSAPSASELKTFDRLFDGNMTTSEAEALDELFPAIGKAPSRQPRRRKGTS
jgi:hypothetical protein